MIEIDGDSSRSHVWERTLYYDLSVGKEASMVSLWWYDSDAGVCGLCVQPEPLFALL